MDIKSLEARTLSLRKDIISMIAAAGSGHPGGSLSAIDILCALYFGNVLNYSAENPNDVNRDRFILSKGHAAPALYAVLAEAGFFPKEELLTLRKYGSRLQGHPDMNLLPGIDVSTGSLGQGLSIACGMALGLSLDKSHARVFTLLGDGECQEGQVWEAAMFAAHQKLGNLCAIVDCNGLQIDGATADVCNPGNLEEKFAAFGWKTYSVDGHNLEELISLFQKIYSTQSDTPVFVLARTIKGCGVSFMENNAGWHGKATNSDQTASALQELDALCVQRGLL